MKELFNRYKKFSPLLTTLGIFSGMGLIVWFGIIPFQNFVTDKADGIQEYHATRENRLGQMEKLPDLQSQFDNIQVEEDVLRILLSEERVVDFVQTLEQLAKETGVQVVIQSKTGTIIEEKVKPKVVAKKAGAETAETAVVEKKSKTPATILESVPFDRYLHVEVVVKGEYKTIATFLHKMETLPLGLDVIGMTMGIRDQDESVKKVADPGRNPFLILGDGATTNPETNEEQVVTIPGTLEASFDTVVYLDK
ncbi:MAG: hypothetical protein KBD27_02415 [Candidatus Moranbacteria bacterium]|nr:hypothetical protein [Candidatus Moranbacteria bacterium]